MSDRLNAVLEALARAGLLHQGRARRPPIDHITADSREARPGSLFLAIPGSQADGHAFVPDAVRPGPVW